MTYCQRMMIASALRVLLALALTVGLAAPVFAQGFAGDIFSGFQAQLQRSGRSQRRLA